MVRSAVAACFAVTTLTAKAQERFQKVPLEVLPERARHGALARSGRFEAEAGNFKSQGFTLAVPLSYDDPSGSSFDIHYFVDESEWDQASGPIFVSMGGEGGVGGVGCSRQAVKHRALCVGVEHRFYGNSLPPQSQGGVDTETYRAGLRSEWNLRDTAAVIDAVQARYVGSSGGRTVMNFGGSYSGGTCAWFRQLFPDKTAGCVSESGVVNVVLNFVGFDDQIAKAYGHPDKSCALALNEAMSALERAFAAGRGNEMKELFGAPKLVGTPMGDNDFWYGVADGAAMIDQYGGKAELCDAFKQLPESPSDDDRINNLKKTLDHHYGKGMVGGGFYDSECLKSTAASHCTSGVLGGLNDRSWRFQKCNENAYLQPAPAKPALAMRSSHLTLEALLEQCDYVFGEGQSDLLKANNAAFQSRFGGADPRSGDFPDTSNIFFLDYSDDPWTRASVESTTDPSLPYCMTTCDGCGHCGSGVPSYLTKCSDASSEFISQILGGATGSVVV